MQSWRPTADLAHLQKRAHLLSQLRAFFIAKNILEVETPLLCHASITDPNLHSISANVFVEGKPTKLFLQTSPEFAMKRLLCAGIGPIFQICKAFRDHEQGARHNPEFTMLEWYRPGFTHHQLMREVEELIKFILPKKSFQYLTYQQAFLRYLNIDPFQCEISKLIAVAKKNQLGDLDAFINEDKDTWLNLLLSHCIEPKLGQNDFATMLYHFPASQAALAKVIKEENISVAARFELFMNGMEIANGFYELQNASEQRARLESDREKRLRLNLSEVPVDEFFLNALEAGLPDCAGVALGVDRLLMVILDTFNLKDVVSFTVEVA